MDSLKCTTSYTFLLGSGAINWSSKHQPTITLPSTKVKHKATIEATKDAIWIKQLLQDIGQVQLAPTIFNCDHNQSCIALSHDHKFHARIKHIEIQYHYICEIIKKGMVKFQYCNTNENIVDIFTKSLTKNKHQDCAS
jgi:hypothetical protein